MPAASSSVCDTALSMHTADASAAQPTNGMPASCSSPCTVPSSPFLPCRTGITASTRSIFSAPGSTRPWTLRSGERNAWRLSGEFSHSPFSTASGEASVKNQRPLFVMPTDRTSYFSRERLRRTVAAESREISCSDEQPPKRTAIVFFIANLPHNSKFSGTLPLPPYDGSAADMRRAPSEPLSYHKRAVRAMSGE